MEQKIVSIYQPNYLPPMHYIERILSSDVFVLLDDVQLNRRVGQTRADIVGKQGKTTLNVPVTGGNRVQINEAVCAKDGWMDKHIRTLKGAYGYKEGSRSKEWIDKFDAMLRVYDSDRCMFSHMCDSFLRYVLDYLDWGGEYIVASEDDRVKGTIDEDPSTRMMEITRVFGGTDYLCGAVAAEQYLDKKDFQEEGIGILVQDWKTVEYKQRSKEFVPNASIIDGLIMLDKEGLKKTFMGGKR